MSYELADLAQSELEAILEARIELAGIVPAARLYRDLYALFELIGALGAPGALRPDFASRRYRFVPKDTYWVVWRPDESDPDHRVIVRIIDARRDVAGLLRDLDL